MADPVAPAPLKPGTSSSELWVTLGTVALALLVHAGIIPQLKADQVGSQLPQIIAWAAPVVYVIGRVVLKALHIQSSAVPAAPSPVAPAPAPASPN
jgi:hypothetical protein